MLQVCPSPHHGSCFGEAGRSTRVYIGGQLGWPIRGGRFHEQFRGFGSSPIPGTAHETDIPNDRRHPAACRFEGSQSSVECLPSPPPSVRSWPPAAGRTTHPRASSKRARSSSSHRRHASASSSRDGPSGRAKETSGPKTPMSLAAWRARYGLQRAQKKTRTQNVEIGPQR